MSPPEAFKLGFLLRCAEAGMNPGQVEAHLDLAMTKRADPIGFGSAAGAAINTAGSLAGMLGGLALVAPPALGYGAGRVLAKATERDIDHEDIKTQELIAEYRRLARTARAAAELKRKREKSDL